MIENKGAVIGAVRLTNLEDWREVQKGVFKLLNKFDDIIPPLKNAQIMLKVNLCLLLGPETGATVDIRVVRCFIDWLFEKRHIKEVVIAEADATHMSADVAFRALGWKTAFGDLKKVHFLNLSRDKCISVNSDRTYIKELLMSETYMNCDWLVSIAKLKTHTLERITCTLKNIFGAIPTKAKILYHPRLTEAICDANSARLPDFGFIDGLISMENDGPTKGTPRRTSLLLAGSNTVSLDHYAAKIMGFNPSRVPHVHMALTKGMGSESYKVLNPKIQRFSPPFAFMPFWKQMVRWAVGKLRRNL